MGVYSGARCGVGVLALALLTVGCGKSERDGGRHERGGTGGDDGGRGGTSGSGATTGGTGIGPGGQGGTGGTGDDECTSLPLVERRLVRLTEGQIVSSVAALVGDEVARAIATEQDIPPPAQQGFPRLLTTGVLIGDLQFSMGDRIADAVGKHVFQNFASVTGCGTAPTDACAREFLTSFAEKAFRRPVADAELDNILVVYDESKSFGGTIQEGVQHGVWAIFDSPLFLYRTEYGSDGAAANEVRLTAYEMANALSYFLTDAPPDAELLDAASRDELGAPEQIAAHTERLLETPAARANLEAAMLSYFSLAAVPSVVIDPAAVPGVSVTSGLLAAIYREGELFFREHLWNGELVNLLTTRQTWVNADLATTIYGVSPPTRRDADGFGIVELPEERAGLLTNAAFLTARSRPDGTSVVGRGLAVNAALLCAMNPPFPDPDAVPPDPELPPMNDWSERQKAEYRMTEDACRDCHLQFDAFGLTLDVFDMIGRHRTTDPQGRPIDPAVTPPAILDGQAVSGPAEMAALIARSERFEACMVMNFMNFALTDTSQGGARAPEPAEPTSGCEVQAATRAFLERSDPSFSALVTEVARSPLFRIRQGGP
jgi:hypothetical protein